MGTETVSLGQSGRGVALTAHLLLACKLEKEYSNILLLIWAFMVSYTVNVTFKQTCSLYEKDGTLTESLRIYFL
jgi:hypothetical protein